MSRSHIIALLAVCCAVVIGLLALRSASETRTVSRANEPAENGNPSAPGKDKIRPGDATAMQTPQRRSSNRLPPNRQRRSGAPAATTASPESTNSDPYISEDLRGVEPGFNAASTFAAAEKEFGVPAPLLQAVAYAETEMQHGDGSARPGGGRGIMNLKDENASALSDAATLLGVDKSELVRDPVQNVRGAAALLRKHYEDAAGNATNTDNTKGPWHVAVAKYFATPTDDGVSKADQIRNILREGFTHITPWAEEIQLQPGQDQLLR